MRINLDLSGCVNGIPVAVRGKGHFGVCGPGQGSRLDIELVADLLPLQWDLVLALPGFLDPLLFVLSRSPSVVGASGGTEDDEGEFIGGGVRAATDWTLVNDVDQDLGRAQVVHSIEVGAGVVTLQSQLRTGRFELEVGERVASMNIERTGTPLPAGLEGCALLSAGDITTSRGRDCSYVSTTRVSWLPEVLGLHGVNGPTRVAIDRGGWSKRGGRVRIGVATGEEVATESPGPGR